MEWWKVALHMKIEIHGFASIKAEVRTVGDLRELVKWLDKYHVNSDRDIEYDTHLWIPLADTHLGDKAEMISCGDHIPPDDAYDVIINTHTHAKKGKKEPPKYDWPSIDKYATVWDGVPE